MNDSIIPFQLIVLAQFLISLTFPLMIVPTHTKRARYTSDTFLDAISVTSGYLFSTLNTPSNYPQLLEPNYDDPDTLHTIMSDNPYYCRMTRK